jgi:hypothetical protein
MPDTLSFQPVLTRRIDPGFNSLIMRLERLFEVAKAVLFVHRLNGAILVRGSTRRARSTGRPRYGSMTLDI